MATEIPHFAVPFKFTFQDGKVQAKVNEQNSEDEIFHSVEVIVRYPRGTRPEFPEFGVTDQTFTITLFDADMLREEIDELEERAATAITANIDRFQKLMHNVRVEVDPNTENTNA